LIHDSSETIVVNAVYASGGDNDGAFGGGCRTTAARARR
jgi:hypothetical protein